MKPLGLGLPVLLILTGMAAFPAGIPGDVNGDGKVDCADIEIVKRALGKKAGDPGFDARADVVNDGKIDVRDLSFVAKRLPQGDRCAD